MEILIPKYCYNKYLNKIKALDEKLEVSYFTVEKTAFWGWQIWLVVASRFLPYGAYQKVAKFINKKVQINFKVNNTVVRGNLSDAEGLLVHWGLDQETLQKLVAGLPKLRWVHTTMTGIDLLPENIKKDSHIKITASGKLHSQRMAEFALSAIFLFAKRWPEHGELKKRRIWKELPGQELSASTLGIVGLGNIGEYLAKKAQVLGLRVISLDKEGKPYSCVKEQFKLEEIHQFMGQTDFLVLACAATSDNYNFINYDNLKLLKPSSYLINIARGSLLDEAGLLRALQERKLAGVSLDVAKEEPLPKNHPFYSCKNVFLTHHSAFGKVGVQEDVFEVFLRQLNEFILQSN
jgi:phosphoglycerate dehydrogenase-like enzyme